MPQVNTGVAFFKTLVINEQRGAQLITHYESILDPIPGTAYGAITEAQLQALSVAEAQARYDAQLSYMGQKYDGFSGASTISNAPINPNETLCPLPGATATVSVLSDGNGTATVNGLSSVEVPLGTYVTLTATPAQGYEFNSWYINGVKQPLLGSTASYQANGSVTLEARFRPERVVNRVALSWARLGPTHIRITATAQYDVASSLEVQVYAEDDFVGAHFNELIVINAAALEGSTTITVLSQVNGLAVLEGKSISPDYDDAYEYIFE